MQKMARRIGVIRKKTFVTSPARLSLKIPRLERTAELCQLYGRRHFHSRVDNLRAQKYRADLARNRIVAIKIPTSVALGWRRMGLVRGHAKRPKTTSSASRYAFVRNKRPISIRRVNAKSGFTNNVVWKILLRSRAPYGFVRNLGRYNLAVNQDKRVARTSFTVSAPKFSARNARDTQETAVRDQRPGPLPNSQYADSPGQSIC